MKADRERQLDRLLGQGRVPGPEHERILARVLGAQGIRDTGASRLRFLKLSLFGAAISAAILLGLRFSHLDELRSRGVAPTPALEVTCVGGSLDRCPIGSSLLFEVRGAESPGLLTAYAEPESTPSGDRIWYFGGGSESPAIRGRIGPEVVKRVVKVGNEHASGRYRLRVVLSDRALSREEGLSASPPSLVADKTFILTVSP